MLDFRLPDGVLAYYDPGVAATCTPYQDFVYTGTNLLIDGDMEAVGVASWTSGGGYGAVLSKVADPRPGSLGAQCLRITNAGAYGIAQQDIFGVANERYSFSHWLKTDGTANTSVGDGAAGNNITSTVTPAIWTQYTRYNFGAVIRERFWKASLGGNWVQVDDAFAWRVPILTQADPLIGSTPLTQSGLATVRPTYLNDAAALAQGITGACFQYDGISQYWNSGFIPPAEFTAGGWFWLDSVAAGVAEFISAEKTSATPLYCTLRRSTATLQAICGTGASAINHGTALTALAWHHIMFGRSGTTLKVWLDSVPASNLLALDPSTLPLWVMARNDDGIPAFPTAGYTGKLGFWNRLLTDAEVLAHYNSTFRA